jgi:carbonic anhydrase/acetyltransferase-like protein (isoleucine patch superfamily)
MQSIHPSAWIAPGAQLYGEIEIAEGASLWPHVVIRAEAQQVRVGRFSNLQDFVMVHIGYGDATEIGDFCSITHHTTIHGCTIEDDCLIGINVVIMDGAVIGRGSIVAPGAVVLERTEIPPHSIVAGVPAKVIKQRDSERENRMNAWQYYRNARAYLRGEYRAWEGDAHRAWVDWIRDEIAADRDLAEDFDPRVQL